MPNRPEIKPTALPSCAASCLGSRSELAGVASKSLTSSVFHDLLSLSFG
jgi:hypothetical protein